LRLQIEVLPAVLQQPKLELAHLQYNKLYGELTVVTEALGKRETPSVLHQVDLSHNQLHGGVPKELTRLGLFHESGAPSQTPRYLNLAANNLEGEIPLELRRVKFAANIQVRTPLQKNLDFLSAILCGRNLKLFQVVWSR
jgi:hypothetical protein